MSVSKTSIQTIWFVNVIIIIGNNWKFLHFSIGRSMPIVHCLFLDLSMILKGFFFSFRSKFAQSPRIIIRVIYIVCIPVSALAMNSPTPLVKLLVMWTLMNVTTVPMFCLPFLAVANNFCSFIPPNFLHFWAMQILNQSTDLQTLNSKMNYLYSS